MTFELARRERLNYTNGLDLITFLALSWLLFLDAIKISGPWLVRRQVTVLSRYDLARKVARSELETCKFVYRVGGAFLAFSFIFVLIQALEGVLKWLQ